MLMLLFLDVLLHSLFIIINLLSESASTRALSAIYLVSLKQIHL